MGYYTRYELSVKKGNTDLISEFVSENENAAYALDDNGDSNESCKWYDHEYELKAFSLKHPETLFELKGEGEESGDIWIKYIQNGKCQYCKAKLVFDDFDEAKLK
jgi:hypothetical protein